MKPTWKRYVTTHASAVCINWRALSGWPDDKDSIRTIIRNMCFSFVMLCSDSKNKICLGVEKRAMIRDNTVIPYRDDGALSNQSNNIIIMSVVL